MYHMMGPVSNGYTLEEGSPEQTRTALFKFFFLGGGGGSLRRSPPTKPGPRKESPLQGLTNQRKYSYYAEVNKDIMESWC